MSGRSRQSLHLSKLDEFAAYCAAQGFERVAAKDFEVLRMTRPNTEPVIVHAKSGAKEHATTWGQSARMYVKWKLAQREGATP